MMVSSQMETVVGFRCMEKTLTDVAWYGNVLNLGKLLNIHATRSKYKCSKCTWFGIQLCTPY